MHLKFRNVNDAFQGIISSIHLGLIKTDVRPSRVGETLQCVEPMLVTYDKPLERVLFNEARDANPFFHLFESLWMLAGRNDVAPLKYFSSKIGDVASDDGQTFNGAYGYRWRHSQVDDYVDPGPFNEISMNGIDQLAVIVDHLKRKPESRRVVLQMWNVEDDLLKIDSSKDVCCNLSVLFSVESGDCPECEGDGRVCIDDGSSEIAQGLEPRERICPKCKGQPHDQPRYLNMTVCNRSNDLIWGMLGANVVHFSFLQEYMAARIGLEVGTYNQFTNNLHVYTETNSGWHPTEWLKEYGQTMYDDETVYAQADFKHFPLVASPETFDREVKEFIDHWREIRTWSEPFLEHVAKPLMLAFAMHKERRYAAALHNVGLCQAEDWRYAAKTWILQRNHDWEEKQANANPT